MPRKKLNIKTANQTDGMLRPEEDSDKPKYQPTTLSQLWGETNGSERYGTQDIEEYTNFLKELNTADLREHATKVNVVPAASRERLEKRLLIEFQKYTIGFQPVQQLSKKEKPVSKEVLKILSEIK
jgi:hypothetical protein